MLSGTARESATAPAMAENAARARVCRIVAARLGDPARQRIDNVVDAGLERGAEFLRLPRRIGIERHDRAAARDIVPM